MCLSMSVYMKAGKYTCSLSCLGCPVAPCFVQGFSRGELYLDEGDLELSPVKSSQVGSSRVKLKPSLGLYRKR